VSRSVDLSTATRPNLRFLVHFSRDDEVLEVLTSTDGGATWELRHTLDENAPGDGNLGGAAIEVPLPMLAGEADVRFRFRYRDPQSTDSANDHAVLDDILLYDFDPTLFADGFEGGGTAAWSSSTAR
jgi:hypothetical protein